MTNTNCIFKNTEQKPDFANGDKILKRGLNAHENDVLDECFRVLPEETKKRKQEVDDLFHSLL